MSGQPVADDSGGVAGLLQEFGQGEDVGGNGERGVRRQDADPVTKAVHAREQAET